MNHSLELTLCRGHALTLCKDGAIICNNPLILQRSIELPTVERDSEPLLLSAFIMLVRLFCLVDENFIKSFHTQVEVYTKYGLANLQRQVLDLPDFPRHGLEVQKVDVCITQQWMRTLVWQLSLSHMVLSSNSADQTMTILFPAQVARDTLSFLRTLSADTLVAHGSGMVTDHYHLTDLNAKTN
jgi:hypothetical protein